MAHEYVKGYNLVEDFFVYSLMNSIDLTDKNLKIDIYNSLVSVLEVMLLEDEMNYISSFEFKIERDGDKYKVIGGNFLSALWLSGIFPDDIEETVLKNTLILEDKIYTFDEKTERLIIKRLKN